MSRRYGWSASPSQTSPYPGGAPPVTDDDFDYITSQDLNDPMPRQPRSPEEPDDVLLIKNKGATYPAHFPAFAIGDGKLRVDDVRERVGLMMDLSEKGTRRVKLIYKGRQLKSASAPVRDYGVKNKSELMAVIPDVDDGSSPSEEEMVIVDGDPRRSDGKKRRKKKPKKRANLGDGDSASSPRDSVSTLDPPRSPKPAASGPMKVLDDLSIAFTTTWLPLCDKFVASPPTDAKKREEEHRRLSESIMGQILLKLDAVETDGVMEVRNKRKELVKQVQATLKTLDSAKEGKH